MSLNICVVYLVREPQALEPFMRSYSAHSSGIDQKLLFLSKGNKVALSPNVHKCACNDFGGSLLAFGSVLRRYGQFYDYFCLLNSWSVILADNWLAKLYDAASDSKVGIAGCTGSWESFRSTRLNWQNWILPKFPNYHVRTNGVMLKTEVAMEVWPRFAFCKKLEYLAECGKQSVTRTVERMGLEPVVVGANGAVYSPELWRESNTFRVNGQENLLIADNQTRNYAGADLIERRRLTKITWG